MLKSTTTTTTAVLSTESIAPQLPPRCHDGDHPTSEGRTPPDNPTLRILLHHPGRYLAVDKPADVRIDGDFTHTVEKLALSHLSSFPTQPVLLRFVHRLDYATSGVLLLGLSRNATGQAARQFQRRDVHKHYIALVHGHVPTARFAESGAAGIGEFAMCVGEGRPALTEAVVVAHGSLRGAPISKLQLLPRTGRRHQLRVHCAHRGFPIVGDATYGGEHGFHPKWLPHRMMLHAVELRLCLPRQDIPLKWKHTARKTAVEVTLHAGDIFTEHTVHGLRLWQPRFDDTEDQHAEGHPAEGHVEGHPAEGHVEGHPAEGHVEGHPAKGHVEGLHAEGRHAEGRHAEGSHAAIADI